VYERGVITPFGIGELVEVDSASVRAVARVRESSGGGRLHIAFEMGQYMPWGDADVHVRHFGNDATQSCVARIIHAGSSTALLQLVGVGPSQGEPGRGPYDTIPTLD
jgi:hypothetical protein